MCRRGWTTAATATLRPTCRRRSSTNCRRSCSISCCMSVLRSFQADLAAFVTSRDDAARLIDEIRGRHVLLRRVDRSRRSGVVSLPSDVRRLPGQSAGARAGIDPKPLHRRAALWFVQQGRFADAMRSAALCDDLELSHAAWSMAGCRRRIRWRTSAWWHAGPKAWAATAWRPIRGCCAWARGRPALTARMDLAERWLTRLETTADADGLADDPTEMRHRLLLRAVLATHRDDEPAALAALQGWSRSRRGRCRAGWRISSWRCALHWLSAQGHHLAARCCTAPRRHAPREPAVASWRSWRRRPRPMWRCVKATRSRRSASAPPHCAARGPSTGAGRSARLSVPPWWRRHGSNSIAWTRRTRRWRRAGCGCAAHRRN